MSVGPGLGHGLVAAQSRPPLFSFLYGPLQRIASIVPSGRWGSDNWGIQVLVEDIPCRPRQEVQQLGERWLSTKCSR